MAEVVINQNVRDLAAAYVPNVEAAQADYAAAIVRESIVDMSVGVFRALAPHVEDLDRAGVAILSGVADLIVRFRAYGLTSEAEALGALARERLTMME